MATGWFSWLFLYIVLTVIPFGAYCQNSGDVRLVNGEGPHQGRVEIFYNHQWGTICDDSWGDDEATVVCRQLGYSTGSVSSYMGAFFGQGSGPIQLDEMLCTGAEYRLQDCVHDPWLQHNCVHSEDAGVECIISDGDLRLVNGKSTDEGRVEIYHAGEWGTICDDGWDNYDAEVVCRQFGYNPIAAVASQASDEFGTGTGTIWLDQVGCSGYESRLDTCSSRGWGNHYCTHYEDAAVSCNAIVFEEGEIRLVGGASSNEGRVEIYHNMQWGTVCDDHWTSDEARVVCRQLGFETSGAVARGYAYYGEGSGTIWLDEVYCGGHESRLSYCSVYWGQHDCTHYEDAGVSCEANPGLSSVVIGVLSVGGIIMFVLCIGCVAAAIRHCNRRPKTPTTVQATQVLSGYPTNPGAYPTNPNNPGAYPTTPNNPGAYPTTPNNPGTYPTNPGIYPSNHVAYNAYPGVVTVNPTGPATVSSYVSAAQPSNQGNAVANPAFIQNQNEVPEPFQTSPANPAANAGPDDAKQEPPPPYDAL